MRAEEGAAFYDRSYVRHVCLPCSVPFARGRLLGKHQPSEFGYYILVRAASQSLATRTVQHAAVQIHPPQADIAFGVSSLPALRVAIGRVTVPISTQSAATVGILRTQAFRRVTGYSDLFSCRHRAMSATALAASRYSPRSAAPGRAYQKLP